MNKKIIILGAGISGLATAHWLKKAGFEIHILESKDEPGGSMETISKDGYTIDFGPNSGLETTPLISQLAEEVGIKSEMIYANEEANKRYIFKNDELHPLPTSPPAFIKTKLFSAKAKLRVMGEPFSVNLMTAIIKALLNLLREGSERNSSITPSILLYREYLQVTRKNFL